MDPVADDTSVTVPSWPLALVRAIHPVRWGLCAAGLVASLLVCMLALSFFEKAGPRPEAWVQTPLEELRRLGDQLVGKGSGTAVWRCGLLAAVLMLIWCPIAAWIARSELLCHRDPMESNRTAGIVQAPPSQFVLAKLAVLYQTVLVPGLVALFVCLPTLLAGWINLIPDGVGAVLVSVLLPFVVLSSFMLVAILGGWLAFPIMPVTIAAEGSDALDALSRGYSYFYQRPYSYGWWAGLALAVSGLPLAAVLWSLHEQPDLFGPVGRFCAVAVGAVLSLSCFWTLQPLVYLKMRRLVDDEPENRIWDGPLGDERLKQRSRQGVAQSGESSAGPAPAEAEQTPPAPKTLPRLRHEPRTDFSFGDTLGSGHALWWGQLVLLFVSALWAALLLLGAALAAWQATAAAGQELTPQGLWEAVPKLAEQNFSLLTALVLGVVGLGVLGSRIPLKGVARFAAVHIVFARRFPMRTAVQFARASEQSGLAALVLATAGVQLFLIASGLLALAFHGACDWHEAAVAGGLAASFLALGALGLGAVAVEGPPRTQAPVGALGPLSANAPEVLASAVAALAVRLLRSVVTLGFVGLVWLVLCETLSWTSGETAQWVRWGVDGRLWPGAEGILYQGASVIAGLWFVLLFGVFGMYPLAQALHWGVLTYLRARAKVSDTAAIPLKLTPDEQAALEQQRAAEKELEEPVTTARVSSVDPSC